MWSVIFTSPREAAVSKCLEHRDSDVRKTVMEALALVAEKGDKNAIAAVS